MYIMLSYVGMWTVLAHIATEIDSLLFAEAVIPLTMATVIPVPAGVAMMPLTLTGHDFLMNPMLLLTK